MALKRIELKVDAQGEGVILLDGEDISDQVVGIDIQAYAGEATKVVIAFKGVGVSVDCQVPVDRVCH